MSGKSAGHTGGCQCGAVRFRVTGLGRASICYCRMCQKAFGNMGAPLVAVTGLTWTRGQPAHFQSSNIARRGFCAACGTPLSFEDNGVELAICAFDDASAIAPEVQLARKTKPAWVDHLASLPPRPREEAAAVAAKYGTIVSHQHPDHDTDGWSLPAAKQTP